MHVNQVVLTGDLISVLESVVSSDGRNVALFSLVVKDEDGLALVDCRITGESVPMFLRFAQTGARMYVTGALRNESGFKVGRKGTKPRMILNVRSFQMVGQPLSVTGEGDPYGETTGIEGIRDED